MGPNPQETTDLVTFTEEILNGKLHFFVQCKNMEPVKYALVRKFFLKVP